MTQFIRTSSGIQAVERKEEKDRETQKKLRSELEAKRKGTKGGQNSGPVRRIKAGRPIKRGRR